MKKMPATKSNKVQEMASEYRFDYRKAKPNRFAGRAVKNCTVVELNADVSKVFSTAKSVNTALRAFIAAMPRRAK